MNEQDILDCIMGDDLVCRIQDGGLFYCLVNTISWVFWGVNIWAFTYYSFVLNDVCIVGPVRNHYYTVERLMKHQ